MNTVIEEILNRFKTKSYTLFRLYNSYKQIEGKYDYRMLEVGELPDIKRFSYVHDVDASGAIMKAEMLMLKLLSTIEYKTFNDAFANNQLIINFSHPVGKAAYIGTQSYMTWVITMSAYNPKTNENLVIETLLIDGEITEE